MNLWLFSDGQLIPRAFAELSLFHAPVKELQHVLHFSQNQSVSWPEKIPSYVIRTQHQTFAVAPKIPAF